MMTKNEARISVIVPVYNVEKYLVQCVESICGQTYRNLEIILIDDGSTDSSVSLCDELAKKDERIVMCHKANGGLSDARNTGLDMACGEYICFVDSDDFICAQMLEHLYMRIQHDCSDLAVCQYRVVDEQGRECKNSFASGALLKPEGVWGKEQYWKELYDGNSAFCVVAWNKLYKRELFEKLRYENGKIHEDEFIIASIVERCKRISIVESPLYCYRYRSESIMGSGYSLKNLDKVEALIARAQYFLGSGQEELAGRTLVKAAGLLSEGCHRLDMGEKENRRRYDLLRREFRMLTGKVCLHSKNRKNAFACLLFLIDGRIYYRIWRCRIIQKQNRAEEEKL